MEVHESGSEIIFSGKKEGITSSTDCQLVSVERLGWRRRLFEQKNAIGTSSQAHSLQSYRSTLCL